MGVIESMLQNDVININTITIRVFLSIVLSGLVGWNREKKRQAAGFRTHILIGIGSTVIMITSIYAAKLIPGLQGDPTRIAAQVISGIGFLGAGAIIKSGFNVKGLNTAASIWVVAGIGLLVGAGLYYAALLTSAATIITLVLFDAIEHRFFRKYEHRILILELNEKKFNRKAFAEIMEEYAIVPTDFEYNHSFKDKKLEVKISLVAPRELDFIDVFEDLKKINDIRRVSVETQ